MDPMDGLVWTGPDGRVTAMQVEAQRGGGRGGVGEVAVGAAAFPGAVVPVAGASVVGAVGEVVAVGVFLRVVLPVAAIGNPSAPASRLAASPRVRAIRPAASPPRKTCSRRRREPAGQPPVASAQESQASRQSAQSANREDWQSYGQQQQQSRQNYGQQRQEDRQDYASDYDHYHSGCCYGGIHGGYYPPVGPMRLGSSPARSLVRR